MALTPFVATGDAVFSNKLSNSYTFLASLASDPMTADFCPGRVTATLKNGLVRSADVERER